MAHYINLMAISGAAKAFSLIEHAVSRSHPPVEINDNLIKVDLLASYVKRL